MELKLIKEEKSVVMSESEVKFNFYKNIIKKDLELACWCSNAVSVFGDFQIYSDHSADLNSFDQMISFITGKNVVEQGNTLEEHISSQCSNEFLNLLVLQETKFTPSEIDNISIKFTNYILEAVDCINLMKDDAVVLIHDLDKKYYGASDLETYKKIN